MNYLLDTCAVSEFTKPRPDAGLMAWLRAAPETSLHLSTLSLGEIQQGVSHLPVSARKQRLQAWFDEDLQPRFAGRLLPADAGVCLMWGKLRAFAAQAGYTLPVLDSLIAATALTHHLVLVTRNQADFARVDGLQVMNPWTSAPPIGKAPATKSAGRRR